MELDEIKTDAYRYAVKNAFLHKGKADKKAVLGKVKALHKDIDMVKIMPIIEKVVAQINAQSFDEIEAKYNALEGSYELKPKAKEEGLPELEWAQEKEVVTRFAPNPNGPFHLGSARAAILSHEYARKYGGKFILRLDDTDPKIKKSIDDAEKIFREDLEWLGITIDEVYFASDRLDIYYDYMRKLIDMGKAYVCDCDSEEWRKKITKEIPCSCREKEVKEQKEMFDEMMKHQLKEGEAVLRIKTDLHNKDPSVRDWWAAKIVDKPVHPRVSGKYVWPSYNFASAIDDHGLGVTLIIRGQEHEQNKTKQEFMYEYLEWEYPHCFHTGRISLEGIVLSTSKISEGIAQGEYTGWDDPRIGTIRALRRRGFTAETLRKMILEVGIKSSDTTVSMDTLIALNKDSIGEVTRYPFIREPGFMDVDFCPETEVEISGRHVSLKQGTQRFTISIEETKNLKPNTLVRLRNAYNVRIKEIGDFGISAEYVSSGVIKNKPIVSWILDSADVVVWLIDNTEILGTTEISVLDEPVDSHLFLDRTGYCRVDGREGNRLKLRFTHK
ncbi:MAG: glutamate--tRNA ligase [Candidatus Diapherotrites archaeon]